MTANSSENSTIYESTRTVSFEANRIKFWILLTLQLFSLPCFAFVLYRSARTKRLGRTMYHQVYLLLLVTSFLFVTVALSLTLAYLYGSHVLWTSDAFCSFWNWFHYSLNIINLFLMAFGSMERYWLVFHPWLVQSARGKFLFHYCPLTLCIVYPPVFYIAAIFLYPCSSYYDYNQLLCQWPCYFSYINWSNTDLFVNNYAPLLITPVFCGIIYTRFFARKQAMSSRGFRWRRDRKLIIQLWATSTLYLSMWLPLQITSSINMYWLPDFLYQAQIDYLYLFPDFVHLFYPYILLVVFYSEMKKPRQQ